MKKNRVSYILIFLSVFSVQCTQLQRSQGSGYSAGAGPQRVGTPTSSNSPVVAPSEDSLEASQRVHDFEKRMNSRRDKEHYSRLLPWFESDNERILYLSQKDLNQREKFAQDQGIWRRAQSPSNSTLLMIQNQDIAVGMPQDYVRKSWGDPQSVEVSGDPLFRNEKWRYVRQVSSPRGYTQERRTVFFEGGKVAGWQTE